MSDEFCMKCRFATQVVLLCFSKSVFWFSCSLLSLSSNVGNATIPCLQDTYLFRYINVHLPICSIVTIVVNVHVAEFLLNRFESRSLRAQRRGSRSRSGYLRNFSLVHLTVFSDVTRTQFTTYITQSCHAR